jgi:hypothetical protein
MLPVRETLLVKYTDQAILLRAKYLQTAVNAGLAEPCLTTPLELGANSTVE